jgi:hypothetical protein
MLPTKPTLLLWAWLLLPLGTTHAQTEKTRGRWEIGVDALSIFNANEFPKQSVFVLKEFGQSGLGIRTRIGASGSNFTHAFESNFTYFPNNKEERNLFLMVGIQKQLLRNLPISKKNRLYAGLDVSVAKNNTFTERVFMDFVTEIFYETVETETRITRFSPFLGYSRNLTSFLSIRYEMALNLARKDEMWRLFLYGLETWDSNVPFNPPPMGSHIGSGFHVNRTQSYSFDPFNQLIVSIVF